MCTPIYAAIMGRKDDAKRLITEKLSDKNANLKFTAFFGPGHDWIPDHNWGGSGMIGLQEMLMQTIGDQIIIFPAWPKEWDVNFKLHAMQNTTIEGDVKNGKIISLKVTPESRRKDVNLSSGWNLVK